MNTSTQAFLLPSIATNVTLQPVGANIQLLLLQILHLVQQSQHTASQTHNTMIQQHENLLQHCQDSNDVLLKQNQNLVQFIHENQNTHQLDQQNVLQHCQESHKVVLQELKQRLQDPKIETKLNSQLNKTFEQIKKIKLEMQDNVGILKQKIRDVEVQRWDYNNLVVSIQNEVTLKTKVIKNLKSQVLKLEQQLFNNTSQNELVVSELTECKTNKNTIQNDLNVCQVEKKDEVLTIRNQYENEKQKMESERKQQLNVLAGEVQKIHLNQAVNKAAQQNNLEMVKILLEAGLNTETMDSYGWRPLHNASYEGYLQIVKLLVEHGANVTARVEARFGDPSITLAAINGYIGTVQFFLDQGVPVDITNKYGLTALIGAARNGRYDVAELLLQKGADVNVHVTNLDSRTALHTAAHQGHVKVAKLLLDHGAHINALDKYNETALHWAAYKGELEVAKLLVQHGINVHGKNTSGKTAKQIAAEKNFTNLANFLASV